MISILSVDDDSGLFHQCTQDPEEIMDYMVNRDGSAREVLEKTNMRQSIFKFETEVSGSGQDCGLVFLKLMIHTAEVSPLQYAGNTRCDYNDDDRNGKADMTMKSIIG